MACEYCHTYDKHHAITSTTSPAAAAAAAAAAANTPTHARCARCLNAYYCSVAHQVAHWRVHKHGCEASAAVQAGSTRKMYKQLLVNALTRRSVRVESAQCALLPHLYILANRMCITNVTDSIVMVKITGMGATASVYHADVVRFDRVDTVMRAMDGNGALPRMCASYQTCLQRARERMVRGVTVCAILWWHVLGDPTTIVDTVMLLEITMPAACRMPAYRGVAPLDPRIDVAILSSLPQ